MNIGYMYKKGLRRIPLYKLYAILILFGLLSVLKGCLCEDYTIVNHFTEAPPKAPSNILNDTKNPTIVYWTKKYRGKYSRSTVCESQCDIHHGKAMLPPNTKGAYLFYAVDIEFSNLPLPRQPEKVIWALLHNESPANVVELMHEKILNIFNYSSTFSRYSDVPYPLQYMISLKNVTSTEYFVETRQKNMLLKELAPILYLHSDCSTTTERDKYVQFLQMFQRIDSYGKCLNNKKIPSGIKGPNEDYVDNLEEVHFLKFVARYKFVIAIENGVCEDYITEKLWRALHVGVVPIYFGSPTIRDWLPNEKSAILLKDFPTPKLLSQHIDELMNNDELYEEYLEHKTKGKISNQNLINEIQERPYQTRHWDIETKFICYLCKKLHIKETGVHIVTKRHYNCPKPISALSQKVAELQIAESWDFMKYYVVDGLYKKIMDSNK